MHRFSRRLVSLCSSSSPCRELYPRKALDTSLPNRHDTILFPVGKDKPVRCPECGSAFQTDYHGPAEGDHHHH